MGDVFINAEGASDRVVVVTESALFVANPDRARIVDLTALILQGADPARVLPDARAIPLSAVSSVTANRHGDDMDIRYGEGGKSGRENVSFKDAATRDRALALIERHLGGRFEKKERQFGVVRAALRPVVATVASGALTRTLAGAAADVGLDFLGPTGVWAVGGLVTFGCAVWFFKRVKTPPHVVTLTAR
jgi:hypothetical protein